MRAEDGGFDAAWKPGPRAVALSRALWRGALDLIFPPQPLEAGAVGVQGLAA